MKHAAAKRIVVSKRKCPILRCVACAVAIVWLLMGPEREELEEKQMKGLDGWEVLYPQVPVHELQLM